jgi:hypothetical protein
MEDVGIFYVHLAHFTIFCYILRTFGIDSGNLVHFSHFGILYQEKSGNPASKPKHEIIFSYVSNPNGRISATVFCVTRMREF